MGERAELSRGAADQEPAGHVHSAAPTVANPDHGRVGDCRRHDDRERHRHRQHSALYPRGIGESESVHQAGHQEPPEVEDEYPFHERQRSQIRRADGAEAHCVRHEVGRAKRRLDEEHPAFGYEPGQRDRDDVEDEHGCERGREGHAGHRAPC